MLKRNRGFTLIELLLVIVCVLIIGVWILGIKIICQGNFWFSEEGALREFKIDHPAVTEIIKTKRHVFDKSVITVKENGETRDYCLDSDVLWNYEFSKCSK